MLIRAPLGLAIVVLALLARPALPQQSPDATPTPRPDIGWDPVRATLHAAFAEPPAQTNTATSPLPAVMTVQAWVRNAAATQTPAACAWMWSSVPQDELTAQVQAEIDDSGAAGVTFEASAFGESCVERGTGAVRSFIARDVVFRLTVTGPEAASVGDRLALALPVVDRFVKAEVRPLAEISIVFADADLDPVLLAPTMLDRVLATGARGAALVARLYSVSLR